MKNNITRRLAWIALLAATPLGLSVTCEPGNGTFGLFRGNGDFLDFDDDSDVFDDFDDFDDSDFFDDLEDAFDD